MAHDKHSCISVVRKTHRRSFRHCRKLDGQHYEPSDRHMTEASIDGSSAPEIVADDRKLFTPDQFPRIHVETGMSVSLIDGLSAAAPEIPALIDIEPVAPTLVAFLYIGASLAHSGSRHRWALVRRFRRLRSIPPTDDWHHPPSLVFFKSFAYKTNRSETVIRTAEKTAVKLRKRANFESYIDLRQFQYKREANMHELGASYTFICSDLPRQSR